MNKAKKISLGTTISSFKKNLSVQITLRNLYLPIGLVACLAFSSGLESKTKSVSQLYWSFLPFRSNSITSIAINNLGAGVYIVAGKIKKPAHLADIGFHYFNRRRGSDNGALMEVHLGYVYHWSSNYNYKKASHNVHAGIGIINGHGISVIDGQVSQMDTISGYYFRVGYFRSLVMRKASPVLIGFNIRLKLYNSGSVALAPVTLETEGHINPSNDNSTNLAFIIGTRF